MFVGEHVLTVPTWYVGLSTHLYLIKPGQWVILMACLGIHFHVAGGVS